MNSETMQDSWHRSLVGVNWLGSTSGGTAFNSLLPGSSEPGTTQGGTTGVWYNERLSNSLKLLPVGAVNDTTFKVRVEGLRQSWDGTTTTWIYTPLAELACTAGNQTGTTGLFPSANDRFADTITKTYGGNGVEVVSPGSDGIGYAIVDLLGSPKFRISHANTNGTSCNSLFALL